MARHLHHCVLTGEKPGASREREQINPACSDILANLSGRDCKTDLTELFLQLFMNEVHLPKVGRGGITSYQSPVLNGFSQVSVVFDSKRFHQTNARIRRLSEGVCLASANRNYNSIEASESHFYP